MAEKKKINKGIIACICVVVVAAIAGHRCLILKGRNRQMHLK